MTLVAIILATLAAGIGSVCGRVVDESGRGRTPGLMPQRLLSLAAGALLATAFMHLLPEAFESHGKSHDLFVVLLIGLVFSFCCPRPSYGTTAMSIRMATPTSLLPCTMLTVMATTISMVTPTMTTMESTRMVTAMARAAGPF